MSIFNKALLADIKTKVFQKEAFIPSPQMQKQIMEAQKSGAIPPDPAQQQAGADGGSQVGLDQLGQMIQTGFDGINQALQQLAQMIQQTAAQSSAGAGGEKEKKLSTTERIDRLEQMLQQAMGGGQPPQDPAAAGGQPPQEAPPQDPAAAGAPPVQ